MINLFKVLSISILSSAVLMGCVNDDVPEEEETEIVWQDEFNGSGSLNSTKWTYDNGRGQNGWGNQELQYYTNRPENVSMDGEGNLIITARKENLAGSNYTSARIKTQGLFSQTYGRVEARLKTPYGTGIWPAFWMLGSDISSVSWPQSGEIDIMEMRGQEPSIIHGSIHGPGYSAGNAISASYSLQNDRFDNDFHIYAVEWYPEQIDFFVDDFLYQRIKKSDVESIGGEWVFDKPFFILFNIAVGGNYVGSPSINTSFPQKMTIDYIRVYSYSELITAE